MSKEEKIIMYFTILWSIKCNCKTSNKYNERNKVPRPKHWSGWNLAPLNIEFWLDGDNRIHERLKYTKSENETWNKSLLSP